MKITAQLALSQMKVNKKRTIAGIFAIALATALITTVMCFVTSANKMLTDSLARIMENMEEHTLSCLQYRHCF